MRKSTPLQLALFALVGYFWMGLTGMQAQCPTVTQAQQSFCDVEEIVVAALQAQDTGGGVVWYMHDQLTTPLSAGTGLVHGATYYAGSADGTCINLNQPVTVEIYTAPIGLNFQGVCKDLAENATIADLILTGNNIQWYSSQEGGTPLPISTVLTTDTMYYASQTNPNTGCETSRFAVYVSVIVVPKPVGPPIQYFCNDPANPPRVSNLTPNGPGYNWYSSESSAVILSPNTPLQHNQTYFATSYAPPCESISRLRVLVQFVSPNNAGQNGLLEVCANDLTGSIQLFSGLTGSPQTGGEWTGPFPVLDGHLGTLDTSLLTLEDSPYIFTYTVTSENCLPATAQVQVTVLPLPEATVFPNTTLCEGETGTIQFSGTPNGIIRFTVNNGPEQTVTLDANGQGTYTQVFTVTSVIRLLEMMSTASTTTCSILLDDEITITILPLSEITTLAPPNFCEGLPVQFYFTGTPNATVHYVYNGQTLTFQLDANGEYTLTLLATATFDLTLTQLDSPSTPVCSLPLNETYTVQMVDSPEATISGDVTICPGENASVQITGTPFAVVRYQIGNGPIIETSLNANGVATIPGTYTATTVVTLLGVYTVMPVECLVPLQETAVITVVELPFLQEMTNHFTCPGDQVQVPLVGTPFAIVSYQVNNGPIQTVTLDANGQATLTFNPNTTATIRFTQIESQGEVNCIAPLDFELELEVAPLPTASWTFEPAICQNEPAVFQFTGTPLATVDFVFAGQTYQVVLDANGEATWQQIVAQSTTATLVQVTAAELPNCSVALDNTVDLTVLPLPQASIAADATICAEEEITYTISGTPGAIVTYQIGDAAATTATIPANGDLVLTGTFTSTTTITLLSVALVGEPNCEQVINASITITVIELPEATLTQDQTICQGEAAVLVVNGTPNATVLLQFGTQTPESFTLDANGQVTINPVFTATTVVNLVQVQAADGLNCLVELNQSITVNVRELPTAVLSASQTVCSGYETMLTITGDAGAQVTYQIENSPEVTIQIPASGTYTFTVAFTETTIVRLVSVAWADEPTCTQFDLNEVVLTVIPVPEVAIVLNGAWCDGEEAQVTFTGPANTLIAFTVNGQPQTITLDNQGQAIWAGILTGETTFVLVEATLLEAPNCIQPLVGEFTFAPIPLPSAIASLLPAEICFGDATTLQITGTPLATVTYLLNGVLQTVTLDGAGVFSTTWNPGEDATVELVSASVNECTAELDQTLTVTVIPELVLTVSEDLSLCQGETASVLLTGTPLAQVSYSINGGAIQTIHLNANGTATITQVFNATTTIVFNGIELANELGCATTINQQVTITVQPVPEVSITLAGTMPICEGDTATVNFTGTPNATIQFTANGLPQTVVLDANGQATYTAVYTSNSTISLVSAATSSTPPCEVPATGSVQIPVVLRPNAGGAMDPLTLCELAPVVDLAHYLGADATPDGTWSPALASGTSLFDPAVDAAGTYTYTVAGNGPCPDDIASITINLVPEANAGDDAVLALCSHEDPLDLLTVLGPNAQAGGVWSPALPNGQFNPAVDASGVYTYTINAGEGCEPDSATVTITVTPGLNAGEDATIELCETSAPIDLFTLLGPDATADGIWIPALASGTGWFNPAVDAAGVYTYQSALTDECSNDQSSVTVTLVSLPNAGTNGQHFFCSNDAPQDLFAFLGGTPDANGTWTPTLISGTGIFDPAVDPAGTYTYTIETAYCGTITAEVVIQIGQAPNAGQDGTLLACVTTSTLDLFAGLQGPYQNTGTWTSTDASIVLTGSSINPAELGVGTYTFEYTVDGGQSPCEIDTATVVVTIQDEANAGTPLDPFTTCEVTEATPFDLFTLLENADLGGVWSQGATAIENPIDLAELAVGVHTFDYTVSSPCGEEQASVQIIVHPLIDAATVSIVWNTPVCEGNPVGGTLTGIPPGTYDLAFSIVDQIGNTIALVETVLVNATATPIELAIYPVGTYQIALTSITSVVTQCSTAVTGVEGTVEILPVPALNDWTATTSAICLGDEAVVQIAGLTDFADGEYTLAYSIGIAAQTATVTLENGMGSWTIQATAFPIAGTYTLTIQSLTHDDIPCMQATTSREITLMVNEALQFNGATLQIDSVCLGEAAVVQFTGSATLPDGLYALTYTLADSALIATDVLLENGVGYFQIPAALFPQSGTYTIVITAITFEESTACSSTATDLPTAIITVLEAGLPELIDNGNWFCETDEPTLADLNANLLPNQEVVWYSSSTGGEPLSSDTLLIHNQTYYGSLIGENGCVNAVRLAVIADLSHCLDITIPDGFSPNDDGINDTFEIVNLLELYPNYSIEIYNRYGNILFKGNAQIGFWNGTINQSGANLGSGTVPSGVYFYILNFNDGLRAPVQGRVYLNK